MTTPKDLVYSEEHEWIRYDGTKAWVGITEYAQHSLGDIVFVELPEIGTKIEAMGEAGVVESVKAVSPVFCPVAGTILEVNENLEKAPELLNSAPYSEFIFAIEMSDPTQLKGLMDADSYDAFCG